MKLILLLNWYEESAAWLAATVASCADLVEHVVAVDGAYFLFPQGRARSGSEQAEAIRETATALGMGATVHQPREPWYGNEVEKRSFLFRLAAVNASPEDWFFVLDGDEVVTENPGDVLERLGRSAHDVAETMLWERFDPHLTAKLSEVARVTPLPREQGSPHRQLFRALPGLRVEGAHYVYRAERDGRTVTLWGHDDHHELEPAEDMTGLRVEHRRQHRDLARLRQADTYYERRDRLRVEVLT